MKIFNTDGKKNSDYVELTDEQAAVQIPLFLHQIEMSRLTNVNKRLLIVLIIIFLAFVGTNAGWIIYESQFETITVQQDVDSGEGAAVVSGTGNAIYGQSATDSDDSQAESGR